MLRLKTILTEQEDALAVAGHKAAPLPGRNHYQINSFLEKKTGIDTGLPGWGEKSAEALGVYLFGKNNKIKGKDAEKQIAKTLTNSGYDTKGNKFGKDYAGAVSDIIKHVETRTGSTTDILNNKFAKQFILTQINSLISNRLPYKDSFSIGELGMTKPGGGFSDTAWRQIKALTLNYKVNSIKINSFNNKNKTINATVTGRLNFEGLVSQKLSGTGTIQWEVTNDRYLKLKLKSILVSTPWEMLDTSDVRTAIIAASALGGPWALAAGVGLSRLIPDVGYQLLNNKVRLNFASNLSPLPGYTKWGPYYSSTGLEKSILNNVNIPTIDLKDPAFEKEIRPYMHMIKQYL